MTNIKDLIAEEKFDEAGEILFEGLRSLFNTYVRGVDLSKDEFALVAPYFLQKLENPLGEEPEATDAPGDDIEVVPSKGVLTITFAGPEDDPDFRVPGTVTKVCNVGDNYSYLCPTFDGYVADTLKVTGTMTADGAQVTVTYSAKESGEGEEGGQEGGSEQPGPTGPTGGESGGEESGPTGGQEAGPTGGEQTGPTGSTEEAGAGEGEGQGDGPSLDGPTFEETEEGSF